MTDLPDLIHKLLGAQCKLYVTRCVTRELEELGEGYEKVRGTDSHSRAGCAAAMSVLAGCLVC